jgi:hypothetical protein
MKPGKLARSRSCFGFIVPAALMTNRKSIFPSQPAGCGGPKSGMPMSHVMPSLLDPVLAEEDVDDELELSSDPLEDDAAVEPSDSAGTVVTPGWVTPPKLDAPDPPPQAERTLVSARARWTRMVAMSLANRPADVTRGAEAEHRTAFCASTNPGDERRCHVRPAFRS